jgi:hypothetical protein
MAISGKTRENVNFESAPKYCGLAEVRVINVNPDAEEFEEMMGFPPKEDSKQFDYLGDSKDGNTSLRVDVWLEEVKARKRDDDTEVHEKFKVTFFLEDKQRENKEGTRTQYINHVGVCSWTDDPNNLPDWFKKSDYRVAKNGEEQLYNFVRTWLSKLDLRDDGAILDLEWKKLMRGNVKELKNLINCEYADNVVVLATIKTVEKEGEIKEYQHIYNGGFLHPYNLKFFRNVNYSDREKLAALRAKKPRDMKPYERFVVDTTHEEYGSKDYFILKDLHLYDPNNNVAASDKVIIESDSSY